MISIQIPEAVTQLIKTSMLNIRPPEPLFERSDSEQKRMTYRPEIDGLRAVAVVPVILFHAGVPFFSGGYVGVDVFFVISGYLITGILIREHNDGRFSLVKFYERRARRILPALFAVMLSCVVVGWFTMSPRQLLELARSVVAVRDICWQEWMRPLDRRVCA